MKKRLLSVIFAVAIVLTSLSVFATISSAEGPVVITAGNVTGETGETVTLPVTISNNPGINGFQFHVYYDSTMLRCEGAEINRTDDSITAGECGSKVINYESSGVEFMWTNTNKNKMNNVLVRITFTLLKTGTSTVTPSVNASAGEGFYYIDGTDFIDLECSPVSGTVTCNPSLDCDFFMLAESGETPVSDKAAVALSMINAERVFGFSLELNFDPAKLSFDEGIFSETFPYARAVCLEAGKVRVFACTEVATPVVGSADMATIFFDVIDPDKAVGSTYDVTISFYNGQPAYTLDENLRTVNIMTVGTVDAVITLVDDPFDPFDLNRNGTVDISDVTGLLNYLSGLSGTIAEGANPDLTDDGTVDISDVTALLNYLSGLNG